MSVGHWWERWGDWIDGRWFSAESGTLLIAMANGQQLRAHRDLEGDKNYWLHDGEKKRAVGRPLVLRLREQQLIETNQKFPVATYFLTAQGKQVAEQLFKRRAHKS